MLDTFSAVDDLNVWGAIVMARGANSAIFNFMLYSSFVYRDAYRVDIKKINIFLIQRRSKRKNSFVFFVSMDKNFYDKGRGQEESSSKKSCTFIVLF